MTSAGQQINEAELQQSLQRLATQFQSRASQASFELLAEPPQKVRDAALEQSLLYQSSVLDIATGPVTVVNLLDLLVFAELNADAMRNDWIPRVLGETGASLQNALDQLREEVEALASQVISPEKQQRVDMLVRRWQQQNPGQMRVEGLRLASFGSVTGALAAERAKEVSGLLASVKSATAAADQALLLADRAMFLFQRLPFLWRFQARLGARQIVEDTRASLEQTLSSLPQPGQLHSLLGDASAVLGQANDTTRELRASLEQLTPLIDRADGLLRSEQLHSVLATSDQLSERMLVSLREVQTMGRELRTTLPGDREPLAELSRRVDALVRRWVLYLALAGAACTLFFWVCFYVAKKLLAGS